MGIKLSIEIQSPLEPEDRELLAGLSIMTLAIANHEMAKEHFPGTFPDADEASAEDLPPCSAVDPADQTRVCASAVAHRGRHRFRRSGGNGLAN